jgi:hypothetical protein
MRTIPDDTPFIIEALGITHPNKRLRAECGTWLGPVLTAMVLLRIECRRRRQSDGREHTQTREAGFRRRDVTGGVDRGERRVGVRSRD